MAQIIVGISDLKIACPPDTLITYALGSCVGICLYDCVNKTGGLSHILLPDSSVDRGNINIFKFADTSIRELVFMLEREGSLRINLKAKIAGGANMFESQGMSIGERNVEAVKKELCRLQLKLLAEDTGGNFGRTVELDIDTGTVTVKTISKGIKVI